MSTLPASHNRAYVAFLVAFALVYGLGAWIKEVAQRWSGRSK